MLNSVNTYEQNLSFLAGPTGRELLTRLHRGIEKEGLRVDDDGNLSMTPHPATMGSALTNPWLTTDFSEALLEFITPEFTSIDTVLAYLKDTHALFYKKTEGENIWAGSMPCYLPDDNQIPVARYGTSNIAKMKTVYRTGLGHRYGRAMQTIAGIHYNFSMPDDYWRTVHDGSNVSARNLQDFISQRYLDLIRNFRRNYWILIYLFGAAPCFDSSFVRGRKHNMQRLGERDLYTPYATSLRMGDLGYQSIAQQSLFVCYNELDTYIRTLGEAIHEPYQAYENIGIKNNGEYKQLNTALLQIENEFYSPVRPKRTTKTGETPLRALTDRGVEYIEVRCLDVNPFFTLGIDTESVRFLDTFLLYCLVKESSLCNKEEFRRIAENQSRVVNEGRNPDLKIYCGEQELLMRKCARGMLKDMSPVAELLDQAYATSTYTESLNRQDAKLEDDSLTPSARVLNTLIENDQSIVSFTKDQTMMFAKEFKSHTIDQEVENRLTAEVDASLQRQKELEQDDSTSFDEFLAAYYRQ